MLIHVLKNLTARLVRAAHATTRARGRRSARAMMDLDDHLLRDIGLTRADVVEYLSSPSRHDPLVFLEVRRERNGLVRLP